MSAIITVRALEKASLQHVNIDNSTKSSARRPSHIIKHGFSITPARAHRQVCRIPNLGHYEGRQRCVAYRAWPSLRHVLIVPAQSSVERYLVSTTSLVRIIHCLYKFCGADVSARYGS